MSDNILPPGQSETTKFPVLDLGITPDVTPDTWSLDVMGEVASPVSWRWDEFQALPHVDLTADFHCVTTWSQFGIHWKGVKFTEIAEQVQPSESAAHVLFHGYDGYTTNVKLSACMDDDVIIADLLEGSPIPPEHGGPVRGLVPKLYAWKSIKWIKAIEFLSDEKLGFWEVRGYSNVADPWREMRFTSDDVKHGAV
jgi:DMSO/TMAO reductase YedYZ molybdopterin-dependent catalytic subunit